MLTARDILLGFALPACAAAVVLLLAWRPWVRSSGSDGRWAGAAAIGVGYAIAYGQLVGGYAFPPTNADNWIPYFLVAAAGAGMVIAVARAALWLRVALALPLFVALIGLLLRPLIGADLSRIAFAGWITSLSAVGVLWWMSIDELSRRAPRLTAPGILLLAAIGAAAILGDGGLAQRGGFTCAALAVILGAVLVVGAVAPRFTFAGGGTLAAGVVLFGTITYGYFYIFPDLTPRATAALILALASPLGAWIIMLPRLRAQGPWTRGLITAAATLILVGAAIAVAETAPGASAALEASQ